MESSGATAAENLDTAPPDACTDPMSPGKPLPCPVADDAPVTSITPALLDNQSAFADDFYKRFSLRHDASPLQLTDTVSKDYFFPTFYGDETVAIAMFFCSYEKAKALMPDPSIVPVDMGLGRSLVVFSSFRYSRVLGMDGYNEMAITIPVVEGRLINPPVLPLLLSDWKGLGFYVLSMPVTTLENQLRGLKLWGLPKVVQEIDLEVDGGDYVTSVKEDTGETYLQFRVPMAGDALHVDNKTLLYSVLDQTIVRSPSNMLGDFTTTKWLGELAAPGQTPAEAYLTLGDSPSAAKLGDLEIDPQPFQVRFANKVDCALDLHDDFAVPLAQ